MRPSVRRWLDGLPPEARARVEAIIAETHHDLMRERLAVIDGGCQDDQPDGGSG